MKSISKHYLVLITACLALTTGAAMAEQAPPTKRVPAEWEPQEAVWLQWPGRYEKTYEPAFAKMVGVIAQYQKIYVLYDNTRIREEAEKALRAAEVEPQQPNIHWQNIHNDNAWMRDNGPIYVIDNGEMRIQNWEFDAWGGAFGQYVRFHKDNAVPDAVATHLSMPVDHINVVHERGNLEFNGLDTVILNWSVIGDERRNAGYTRAQAKKDLRSHFGVERVVFVEGVPEGDLTNGHIDGIARFIDTQTVVVPMCTQNAKCKPGDGKTDAVFEAAAKTIEAAGFNVIRDPIEGVAEKDGEAFDTNYLNWIVGNGFVIAVGFDNPATDEAAKRRLQSYFPGRDIHIVEMLDSWVAGGGAHCHTNDQPALSTIKATPTK